MDEAEKQKLKELFDKKAANEAEAVEIAKARLDACLQHLGSATEFVLTTKLPHDTETTRTMAHASWPVLACAMNAVSASVPRHRWPGVRLEMEKNVRKPRIFRSLFNLFKRAAK